MSPVSFYCLGEDPSTARVIDVPEKTDYESLQYLIASHFAVVHPKGQCKLELIYMIFLQQTYIFLQVSPLITKTRFWSPSQTFWHRIVLLPSL